MTTGKRTWFIFQHGEGFIEMQLIYLIDIFDNDYNFLRDCFETDSVNVIKNRCLAAKKQRKFRHFNICRLGSVYQKNYKNCH